MKPVDFGVLSCGAVLNALAQLGLKTATRTTGPLAGPNTDVLWRLLELLTVRTFWYSLFAYAFSVLVWAIGLSRVPVSQAYPLLSLGYLINAGLAWWFLDETPNAQHVLGIGIIVVGVVLVARAQ